MATITTTLCRQSTAFVLRTTRHSSSFLRRTNTACLAHWHPRQRRQQWASSFSTVTTTSSKTSPSSTSSSTSSTDPSTAPLKNFIQFPAFEMASTTLPDVMKDLEVGRRVVILGDVHGDLRALEEMLLLSGLMDPDTKEWIGGDTICVQLGDVLDRGTQELACLELLCRMSRESQHSNGHVQLLWGNHEAMNALGLFQYTFGEHEFEQVFAQPLDLVLNTTSQTSEWRRQYAGNQPIRWACCEPGGILSETLSKFKVAVVVGRTLCVHAGLTQQHLNEGGIEGMNRAAREWILSMPHALQNNAGNYESTEQLVAQAQERASLISKTMPSCLGGGIGSQSPVWMRDYSQPSDLLPKHASQKEEMLNQVLEELSVERMVMGHTPQLNGINCVWNKAWRVDLGVSQGVLGAAPEVLEIVHGEMHDSISILTKDGKRIPSHERQVVDSRILF